jgi:hypothetical protein
MGSTRAVAARTMFALAASLALPAVTSAATESFALRAFAACAAAGNKIERLPTKQTVSQIEAELTITTGLVHRLKTITPPAQDAKKYDLFIAETQSQLTDVRGALSAAKKGDSKAVAKDLKATAAAGQASNRTAALLGIGACAANYTPADVGHG